ncbi:hypothetical protein LEP1GSC125_2035 [Leptospira mayottensis 200901122]|uniref:Uncharacterized protein n=1 Tax=Leptospira mayottensis 200901122 TaxID=1193010 RepID=A0AA87MSG9_9LEPT|nr:hypothetical protein LEP1GSC125_2035 [Leptospira mayottensis 200901122]
MLGDGRVISIGDFFTFAAFEVFAEVFFFGEALDALAIYYL